MDSLTGSSANTDVAQSSLKSVRRAGISAFLIGLLSVIACEIPLILALVGLSGLGSAFPSFALPPALEKVAIAIGILGLLTLLALFAFRLHSRQRL